jgi:hypothetical protein
MKIKVVDYISTTFPFSPVNPAYGAVSYLSAARLSKTLHIGNASLAQGIVIGTK